MTDRATAIATHLAPYFSAGQHLLEIGAGQGRVAQALQNATGARLTLVDIVDYNQSELPLQVYDGRRLPYPDGAFDCSLLIFVLHHTRDPLNLLREALRVSRTGAVIAENHAAGRLRQWVTRMVDSIPHLQHGVPICYRVQTAEEWLSLFQSLPVQCELLTQFSAGGGFWHNFVVRLRSRPNSQQ